MWPRWRIKNCSCGDGRPRPSLPSEARQLHWTRNNSSCPCQSLEHNVIRIVRQIERRQFVACEPANIRGIAPRFEIAANRTAQKINQHIVIPHPSLVVSNQTLIHAQHLIRLDDQSCLLASFTDHRFAQSFTAFEDAARQGPLPKQRRGSTPNQQDTILLDDDRAYTHQRRLRIFTLYAFRFMRCGFTCADYFALT